MGGFLSVEVGLLLISILIAFFSYQGQLRSQMREAIEQLNDTNLSSTKMVTILLHNYSLLKRQTTISFRVLNTPYSGGQGSKIMEPLDRLPDGTREGEKNEQQQFVKFLKNIGNENGLESVEKIEIADYEILVTINSIEPIAVRRVADEIGVHFNEEYSDHF